MIQPTKQEEEYYLRLDEDIKIQPYDPFGFAEIFWSVIKTYNYEDYKKWEADNKFAHWSNWTTQDAVLFKLRWC